MVPATTARRGPLKRRQMRLRVILVVGICVYLFILSRLVFHHYYYFLKGPSSSTKGEGQPTSFAVAENDDHAAKTTSLFKNTAATTTTTTTTTSTKNALAELSKLSSSNNKEERQVLLAESLKRIRQKALQELKDPNHMELRFRENPGDGRPPFSSLFVDPQQTTNGNNNYNNNSNNITADISDLLQFAIIGFGKCASTTMRDWLNTHPRLQCYYPHEVLDLMQHDVRQLLSRLYSMPPGANFLRGFKSPVDLSIRHVMEYYGKYFYKTKLIVGLRHPVHWFESLCT
jgi:hypothetical protein